jgi:curved DNA-binding protein CbpA
MKDPYEQLGLTSSADETQIRRRYLELVREFPPDRAPDRFAEIRAAYDALRNPTVRLEASIFDITPHADSVEAIAEDLRARLRNARFPVFLLASWADAE